MYFDEVYCSHYSATKEFARQITLLHQEQFRKISHIEFLNQAWNSRQRSQYAPNVIASIRYFNLVQWRARIHLMCVVE